MLSDTVFRRSVLKNITEYRSGSQAYYQQSAMEDMRLLMHVMLLRAAAGSRKALMRRLQSLTAMMRSYSKSSLQI